MRLDTAFVFSDKDHLHRSVIVTIDPMNFSLRLRVCLYVCVWWVGGGGGGGTQK